MYIEDDILSSGTLSHCSNNSPMHIHSVTCRFANYQFANVSGRVANVPPRSYVSSPTQRLITDCKINNPWFTIILQSMV